MESLCTCTISKDVDLSLSSTTELHGPKPLHEPPTKRNKPDKHHNGMMHDHLCIYIVLCKDYD